MSRWKRPKKQPDPNPPPGLFDPDPPHRPTRAAAGAARDDGMTRAYEGSDVAWREYAWSWLIDYLHDHPEMFSDELWSAGLEQPREMRAFGSLVRKAATAGMIVKTGRTRPRHFGHLAEGPVWRSLIYRGPGGGAPVPVPVPSGPSIRPVSRTRNQGET